MTCSLPKKQEKPGIWNGETPLRNAKSQSTGGGGVTGLNKREKLKEKYFDKQYKAVVTSFLKFFDRYTVDKHVKKYEFTHFLLPMVNSQ